MDITIRPAGIADMDLLLEWRIRVLRDVFNLAPDADVTGLRIQNEQYYRRHLSDGSHTACFAYIRNGTTESGHETSIEPASCPDSTAGCGIIAGCGGICYQEEMPSPDNPSGKNGYLMNIYCLPEYRGNGIGRKIVEYLISDAKSRGTDKIYLESSKAAKQMYLRIGFADLKDYMKL